MLATIVSWINYKLLKFDTAYARKHPYHHHSEEFKAKLKNDEKRKRQPAYWETWPKKKKRGLPPDQGDIG